jgi:arabinogalactan endo-1,4-beta-galactosidase
MRIFFLLLLLAVASFSCKKRPNTVVDPPPTTTGTTYQWTDFVMGADLSYVNQIEDSGGKYREDGKSADPYTIFKNNGCNLVRVRLWHNPQWQATLNDGKLYNDLKDVERSIRRAKNAGMAVNLDLHYSDAWADPSKQETPAAWKSLSLTTLQDSVYRYTLATLNYLKAQGLTPEMIQVGNETNQGMLFPKGKVSGTNWTAFAGLLNSGIRAVRDFSAQSTVKPQIILHVAQFKNARYFIDNVVQHGVTDFDVLGISHYELWSDGITFAQIEETTRQIKAAHQKKVMIAETACPWTKDNADTYQNIISGATSFAGYEVSPNGQLAYMKGLTQAFIKGGGDGIMYWEPAWISSPMKDLWGTGSSWENNAFFDFNGNALPVMDYMTQ